MSEAMHIFVLAGGSGERFWPLSRTRLPKHLLRLFSDRTLLEETLLRLEGVTSPDRITVLTNRSQEDEVRKLVAPMGVRVVAEPAKRDTAPAAALAHALTRVRDPEGICVLLPADHIIHNGSAFRNTLEDAATVAAGEDAIVTIGIAPTSPSEAFGYLELGPERPAGKGGTRFNEVLRFVEKPDRATALSYIESGRFQWNAGMFLWRASWFQQELERLEPALAKFAREFPGGDFAAYLEREFPNLPKISVDYAIMEKTRKVIAARASFDWDDVGSWTALPNHLPQDGRGNTLRGKTAVVESSGNIVYTSSRRVALCGVNDLVVVETPDAVLVCHRDHVQQIKKVLPLLDESET
ncbi:MAG: mannose-1-phosphate guanylyltransferase [Candidatus Methylacidiphilales bacterium]